jgi:hypothetical protein
MSMVKRQLDRINEQNSPENCSDCKFDWDIKSYIYCRKHEEEYFYQQGEIEMHYNNVTPDFELPY